MIGLCSGGFTWHRDHTDFSLTIFRIHEHGHSEHGEVGEEHIGYEEVGMIPPGASFTFEEGGVKLTVENPCPHAWGPWTADAQSIDVRRCTFCGTPQYD